MPLAVNGHRSDCSGSLLSMVMHIAAIDNGGPSNATVKDLFEAALLQAAMRTGSDLSFARRAAAMRDNAGGFALPLVTAACLAVSAVSFMMGQAFNHRRRRRTAATLNDADFVMVPQLATGKHEVMSLDLCTVLLMDDSRYKWLVLVPRRAKLVEVIDLPPELQRVLWEEVAAAAAAVRQLPGVQKLNIAAIGNICSQLHVHVTGRYPGDAAWPGPCYGVGTAEPYKAEQLQQLVSKLKSAIQKQRGSSSNFNQRRD